MALNEPPFAGRASSERCLHDAHMLQNKEVLDRAAGLPGHSLNLRHDILPGTPVEHVKAAVQIVHERTAAGLGKAA